MKRIYNPTTGTYYYIKTKKEKKKIKNEIRKLWRII
jgi:hypothetical protein